MATIVQTAAIVGASVLIAVLGLIVVRRCVPSEALTPHTAVAGSVYATLGVVYGVILAQVVVAAWDDYEGAGAAVEAEARALLNLVRLAEGFPAADRAAVQAAALAYGRAVVAEEWPAMARGTAPVPAVSADMAGLYRVYARMAAGPVAGAAPYAVSLAELNQLDDARGERLAAEGQGLPDLLWIVLVGGGVLTVCFAYLFGVENSILHAVMVAALATVVALLLSLVHALDDPFREPLRLTPTAFELVLAEAERETTS